MAVFSDRIKTIGERAFQNCTKLRHVRVSASVETIRDQAFDGFAETLHFQCQLGEHLGRSGRWPAALIGALDWHVEH